MGFNETSLIEQLARILAGLESEFQDLVGSSEEIDDPKLSILDVAAERIEFAAFCISTAKRALAGGVESCVMDGARPTPGG